jgi:CheY-like chemotaxis protein
VLLAPDGETALKAAARAIPDLVLMDVMMPGWNGFETCRRLKEGRFSWTKSATCRQRFKPSCYAFWKRVASCRSGD